MTSPAFTEITFELAQALLYRLGPSALHITYGLDGMDTLRVLAYIRGGASGQERAALSAFFKDAQERLPAYRLDHAIREISPERIAAGDFEQLQGTLFSSYQAT